MKIRSKGRRREKIIRKDNNMKEVRAYSLHSKKDLDEFE